MKPLLLPPNIIDHFYLGGARIAELRGVDLPNDYRPEEWLAATNHRMDDPAVGMSRTPDGTLLRDLISAQPDEWIGSTAGLRGDNGILVKLIDPQQRLPVHIHPDRSFAASHLGCPYGKTEAWYVIGTDGSDPSVWLGFSGDVDPDELSARIDAQDSEWMLARMNRVPVKPGDGILVPAGTAHAIGSGVFVAEVQEPTDFSILLEWSVTTATREESHLELGFPLALTALNHQAFDVNRLRSLCHHVDPATRTTAPSPLLPAAADPFFRLHLLAPENEPTEAIKAGFAVLIVLDGDGDLIDGDGSVTTVGRGQVYAVPFGLGDWQISGPVRALACRPGAGWPESLVAP